MVGWHHGLNGQEFEQAPGDSEGQGGLLCCSPWGRQESDTTERLNNWWWKRKQEDLGSSQSREQSLLAELRGKPGPGAISGCGKEALGFCLALDAILLAIRMLTLLSVHTWAALPFLFSVSWESMARGYHWDPGPPAPRAERRRRERESAGELVGSITDSVWVSVEGSVQFSHSVGREFVHN